MQWRLRQPLVPSAEPTNARYMFYLANSYFGTTGTGGNAVVKDVFVAGHPVVKDRHHIDEERIARQFRAAIGRLTA